MALEIHPTAIVDSQSKLENGCTVGPYAIIEEGAILGSNCQIEAHAIIKKRTILGKEVKVGHFAVIGGDPQHLSFDSSLKSKVQIGDYVRIGEGVTVHRSIYVDGVTNIGAQSYLMGYSHVGHDGHLENEVILANGALVGGHVSIGANTFIGGGAGIHQFTRIGQGVMIGGLAEVSKDVPPNVTISGRNLACGLNLIGMKRRGISNNDTKALKHAYRSILMNGGNPLIHAAHCLEETIISTSALAKEFVEFFLVEGRGFVKSKSQG
jgi:UDP-N-acetylglucosamine acyltransferase